MRRLRDGNADAADEVVARLSNLISRLVFRLTGWHEDQEDLVQDVFLQIQAKADSFRGQSSLETWATSITLNRCRNWMRTQSRRLPIEGFNLEEVPLGSAVCHTTNRELITVALRDLNQDERELIVLRYLEEMSLDEMSNMLAIRKNTIEVRLHRARIKLAYIIQSSSAEISDA